MNTRGALLTNNLSLLRIRRCHNAVAATCEYRLHQFSQGLVILNQKDCFCAANRGSGVRAHIRGGRGLFGAWEKNLKSRAVYHLDLNSVLAPALLIRSVDRGHAEHGS